MFFIMDKGNKRNSITKTFYAYIKKMASPHPSPKERGPATLRCFRLLFKINCVTYYRFVRVPGWGARPKGSSKRKRIFINAGPAFAFIFPLRYKDTGSIGAKGG